jgi:small-conductance mechanosensitive channel
VDEQQIATLVELVNLERLGTAALILLITWLLSKGLTSGLKRLGNRLTSQRLLLQQVSALTRFAVYFFGAIAAAMAAVELEGETKLAASGAIGLAVGFGFKDLAATVLAGITILIDKPFQVGDRIEVGGVYGEVRHIGLRSVKMATLDDNLVTIPNSKFMTDAVASANAGELHMLVQQDFFIGTDQDVKRARELVSEAMTSSRYFALKHPWSVLVNQVVHDDYFAIRLRAKGYVLDIHYEKAFETDVTLRVLEAFRAHKIEPPARLTRVVAA